MRPKEGGAGETKERKREAGEPEQVDRSQGYRKCCLQNGRGAGAIEEQVGCLISMGPT